VELSDGSWATFDLDFARVRERLYDIAGSLNHVAQSGAFQGGLVRVCTFSAHELQTSPDPG
jgi:hypothetical protein